MNLGIMPLGNHARNRIIPNLKGTGFTVSAIYSRKVDKIKNPAREMGAEAFQDIDEFFHSDFDAVYISSPNSLHYPHAKKALENGKHVLLEKQMTLKVDEAEELTKIARNNSLVLDIGFHLRFHPAVTEVIKLLDNDRIGEILDVHGRWTGSYSSRVGDPSRGWWEDPAMVGGGSVMGTGVHVIDTISRLCGGIPGRVSGWRSPREAVIDDTFEVNLLYDNRTATAYSSRLTEVTDNALRILGTSGFIEVANFFSTEVNAELFLNGDSGGIFKKGNMYNSEMKAFMDSIEGRESNIATAEDGTTVVKILTGAVTSVMNDSVVDLKDVH